MKITKRQAWYLAMGWAFVAAGSICAATGSGLYGLATFAALMSIACAVQFDSGS